MNKKRKSKKLFIKYTYKSILNKRNKKREIKFLFKINLNNFIHFAYFDCQNDFFPQHYFLLFLGFAPILRPFLFQQ